MNKEPSQEMKFSWWDMLKALYFLLDDRRKSFTVYTTILIAVLFYDLIPTLVISKIVDFFTVYKAGDSLATFYYYVIFLSLSLALIAFIRLTVKKKLSDIRVDSVYFTRVKAFERLLDFSVKWHSNENTGNKVQKIQSGTDALMRIQMSLTQEVFIYITAIIGVLSAFLVLIPPLFFVSLVYVIVFYGIQFSFYRRIIRINYENNILSEKAGGKYFEGLNNLLTIKTLGVKGDFKKNINSQEELSRDFSKKKIALMNNKWKFFQIINATSLGMVLFYTGQSFIGGLISLGTIFVIYNFYQRLTKVIFDSTDSIDHLINSRTSLSRMMPIFWEKTSVPSGTQKFPERWETIEIKDLSFSYPAKEGDSNETGLRNINLEVKRKQKIGVVGKSGSGKSTLAKILLGLYEIKNGRYAIGDISFDQIRHDEITQYVALVLQDSEMFNLSLKENITLMRKWDDELFSKAISICQIQEIIDKLPNGIDTLIGEKGYRLSGGERQRIGIARAIYKDPQILVLDEATSSLDTKTELAIQNAIDTQLADKTIITIAHRTSTLKNVDKVVVFEDGSIVEKGTFQELSANQSSKFHSVYLQESNPE